MDSHAPETVPPKASRSGPKPPQDVIARNCSVQPSAVSSQFPIDSREFWTQLRLLSGKHSDWGRLVSAMEQAREERRKGVRRVSKTREWSPWDVDRASEILKRRPPRLLSASPFQEHSTAANDSRVGQGGHFIWICASAVDDISQHLAHGIPINLRTEHIRGTDILSRIPETRLAALRSRLGASFIAQSPHYEDDDTNLVAHQAVVTMLMMEQIGGGTVSAEFQTWRWLTQHLILDKLPGYVRQASKPVTLILTFMTKDWAGSMHLKEVYNHLRPILAAHPSLSVIPTESEALCYEMKIGDIRRLDDIAALTKNTAFAYRPRTCLGLGNCTLFEPIEPTGHHGGTTPRGSGTVGTRWTANSTARPEPK